MSTLIFVLAAAALIALVTLAPVYFALKNSASGYEDSRGFHGGDPIP